MKNTLRPGSIALGLGLMLTTLCFGQASYEGPPHNVIYWDGDTSDGSLQTLIYSDYTDVIVDFVLPDQNCNLGYNGNLPDDIQNSIQALHNAGKTVLVSFGGSTAESANYAACNVGPEPTVNLANQLREIVNNNGFDGVDIDFEDDSAFEGQAGYDGVLFLTLLTDGLHSFLPPWSIITHAPQTPYWLGNYNYSAPPYALVASNTFGEIAWFNNQTYNQCTGQGPTDCTASAKIDNYRYIVTNFLRGAATKLVIGLAVSPNSTDPPGVGYIPINGDPGNDVQTVITFLEQYYQNQFGGVMGWDYSLDLSDDNGNWGSAVAGGLSAFSGNWTGYADQTGLCLDSNNGAVYTDTCNGGKWRFYVNTIRDAQTNQCLDSNYDGNVYTNSCNGGNFQNWEFYGNVIFDRQTRRCLQSDSNGNVSTAACDVNNPSQVWN